MEFPDDLSARIIDEFSMVLPMILLVVVREERFAVGEREIVILVMNLDFGAGIVEEDFSAAFRGFTGFPRSEDGSIGTAATDGKFTVWIGLTEIQCRLAPC